MEQENMVICKKCGFKNNVGQKYCGKCGNKIFSDNMADNNACYNDKDASINCTDKIDKKNIIASILKDIGIMIIIISVFLGCIMGGQTDRKINFGVALIYWVSGLISGIIFLGLGEIISLLQSILNKSR